MSYLAISIACQLPRTLIELYDTLGIKFNVLYSYNNTNLIWLIANGYNTQALIILDIIKNKTYCGEMINTISNYGTAAIHLIVAKGYRDIKSSGESLTVSNLELLKKIIELGAQIDLPTNVYIDEGTPVIEIIRDKGSTALHFACARRDIEFINFLLEHGADPTLKNHEGYTPFDMLVLPKTDAKDFLDRNIIPNNFDKIYQENDNILANIIGYQSYLSAQTGKDSTLRLSLSCEQSNDFKGQTLTNLVMLEEKTSAQQASLEETVLIKQDKDANQQMQAAIVSQSNDLLLNPDNNSLTMSTSDLIETSASLLTNLVMLEENTSTQKVLREKAVLTKQDEDANQYMQAAIVGQSQSNFIKNNLLVNPDNNSMTMFTAAYPIEISMPPVTTLVTSEEKADAKSIPKGAISIENDEELNQPIPPLLAEIIMQDIKQLIEKTSFFLGRFFFFNGGVNLKLIDQSKRVPHRIAAIYQVLTSKNDNKSELMTKLAKEALDHPRWGQYDSTRLIYQEILIKLENLAPNQASDNVIARTLNN